ncbi:TPA: DUF637 domain-containing protein, partial [Pseudomonas aeruginosa]|nr:DUF637 domain-containing protein [Pseudomonas aeruginosa]
ASGTLASQADMSLRLGGGALRNQQDGLIFSQAGALEVQAGSLDNRQGTLQAQGDNRLRIGGALDNQGGRLDSRAGNLDLQSGSLDNGAGGVLNSAKGWLKLVTGLFDNSAGVTQAQSLEIRAGQGVRNQQGHLSALGGDNRIVTADFDNQGGGLYASGLLSLDGQRFLNQGAAAGQGGKVGAGRIDFSLAGALANRFGQLESESELHLRAAAIDNSGGSLRALGRSGSTRLVAGDLNNAYGVLESANQDLDLQLGSLANAGGRILHTGNGTFGLDSGQVIRAGGELTTNGLLDIRASEWTNSSVLQAGRLNLDIGTFRQTAEGKLLAVQSFTGRGGDWSNDGLLASDGSLRLDLSGGYRGNGRATSLGDFALNAASLDLGNAASLAGGANVTLGAGNLLVNRGRITAAGDLVASAASLNNYGTLGGGGNLRLNAPALLNERGLLFSGADMTLRAGDITNLYGDVYSLGRLDIARDDAGNRAASLRNLSGVIESGKDFSLRASLIENRRAVLESKSGLYTAKMEQTACIEGVNAGDCSGKRNAIWTITQRDKTEVTASSAMGQLLAGGDFAIDGGTLNNLSSLIGSGGNLTANLEVLDNQGLETGELETIRVLRTARGGDIGGIDQKSRNFTNLYWYQSANFDPARAGEIPAALNAILSDWSFEYEFPSKGPTPISSGDQSYAAVIQAAGDVTVNASTRIDNGVTRPGYTFVGSGRQVGDSAVGGSGVSVVVPLTSQLPPDLARRQVNPVTLPGFSLPQGDNGLFRLSSRFAEDGNGSAALGAGADRTQGGSGVSVGQQGAGNVAGTWQGQGVRVDGLAGAANVQGQGGSTLGGSLPGVARVQGVPGNATPSASHKYLIETNPALTELKQFLNSDYLLSGLGMNPDDSKKRLGDGLYEQRLIRDAVVARTGQRYIDGLSSDEALFRYLMDNAIAYKDKLQLQLGVGLSAEQMAALTHDIVWLEEVEVNGEKVLAPVVYLAQAEGRLAPNGALIQGRDVKLVSGGDLHNVGTLRARNDLSATADNLDNSGLIEAGKRLDLLAGDSIRNRQGGVIAGRDVSLTALTGDVINERSVTRYDSALDGRTWERSFADSAARVEADPQLAWLKEAEQRGDVDWRMVQEVHDSWKYSNSGMGPATQIAVAIAAAAIGGMAAAGALSGAGVGASSFAMGAGVGAAGSLSGTAAVSLINNKGDLGKVLKDSFSSDSLKQIAIASLTGGLTAEYFDGILQTKTDPLTGKVTVDLSSLSGVGRFAANQAMQNATSTVLSQALGQGGSLNEALKSALYNSFAAAGFNFVGDIGQEYSLKPGDPSMVTMHALMGGLAAQVSGGDFATGAAAAGANEALVAKLDQAFKSLSPENREAMVTMGSQLVGVLAAAVRDPDATGKALESAAWVAKNSTQYNFLNHQDVADLDNALQKCKSQGNCRQVEEEFKARSDENRRRLNGCVAVGNCAEIRAEIDAGSTALNELVARQETANPGGSDSDIAYGFLMGRNVVDWTTAGQLHLEQTANLWWNGNPQWQKEVGAYLDQTGFNPFGIGVPAMGGAAGKVSAKALMNALKAGELPKGEVAPGKANLPTIGALADAEAGMPYTHPVKLAAKATGTAGKIKIEAGAIPDANEVRAGQGLSGLGYDVTHQTTASAKGIQGQRTADLHVDGLGSIDVYTPKNLDPTKIVRAIEKKSNQAGGVLVQADLPSTDMSSIAARMWGKTNAQSIKTIFFQKPDGSLVRFDRPAGGG